jgi:hypothetical protein
VSPKKPRAHDGGADEINRYEFSGIEERHGTVPLWLKGVIVVMFVWMVVYLRRYWKP